MKKIFHYTYSIQLCIACVYLHNIILLCINIFANCKYLIGLSTAKVLLYKLFTDLSKLSTGKMYCYLINIYSTKT